MTIGMNELKIPFLPDTVFNDAITELNGIFLNYNPVSLGYEPWPLPGDKPVVGFVMAYGDDAIYLKFNVKEKYFRAEYTKPNDPVYKDSCVEFFIGFDNDDTYYNFEFNGLGTPYAAYGSPGKRELLDVSLIKDIKISAANHTVQDDDLPFSWELTLAIPFNLFYRHSITTLKDKVCQANFYKCGDELPEPHFFCWNNVTTPKPNFHQPEYFGKLIFE